MDYTIKLQKEDTQGLRQTVSEAYRAGKDFANGLELKDGTDSYYTRLLDQIEHQAQRIAEQAFEAGLNAPRTSPR